MSEAKDFYKETDNEKRHSFFQETVGIGLDKAKVIFLDLFLYTHGAAQIPNSDKKEISIR